jgi:hypothetical protein
VVSATDPHGRIPGFLDRSHKRELFIITAVRASDPRQYYFHWLLHYAEITAV